MLQHLYTTSQQDEPGHGDLACCKQEGLLHAIKLLPCNCHSHLYLGLLLCLSRRMQCGANILVQHTA